MKEDKKKLREDRKKRIRDNFENNTYTALLKLFQFIGFYKMRKDFLLWAENHRKAVFLITVSFLAFVFVVAIVFRPKENFTETLNAEIKESKVDSNFMKKDIEFDEIIQYYEMKQTLEMLQEKEQLTHNDSLILDDLYQKLNNHKNK